MWRVSNLEFYLLRLFIVYFELSFGCLKHPFRKKKALVWTSAVGGAPTGPFLSYARGRQNDTGSQFIYVELTDALKLSYWG